MKKQTRSILQELNSLNMNRTQDEMIASSGLNLIESAINLITKIHSNYNPEEALDLERRFLNSIRSGDPKKFHRGVKKVNESKKNRN